jgi:hypothetical protein
MPFISLSPSLHLSPSLRRPFFFVSLLSLSFRRFTKIISVSLSSVSLSLWNPRPIALPAYTRSVPSCPVFSLVAIMATPTLPRNKLSAPLTFSPVRPLAWACPLFFVTSCDCALVGSSIRAPDSPPSLLLFAYCLMCWEVVPFFFVLVRTDCFSFPCESVPCSEEGGVGALEEEVLASCACCLALSDLFPSAVCWFRHW